MPGELPAIGIGPRIDYCGVPAGNDLTVFLNTLKTLDRQTDRLPKDIAQRLRKIKPASDMTLFISPSCRFCPAVLNQIVPLPVEAECVYLTIIDATIFSDVAEANKVLSVPTVLVDGQYRWTGDVQFSDLCTAIEKRDPTQLDATVLQRMITEGGAFDLARMMLKSGRIFPAFIELLVNENLSVRLAAMVTVEEMAAEDVSAARKVIEPLWQRYSHMNDAVKGDILYIFGELRSPVTRDYIRWVLDTETNPEIKEAAHDALELINKS